MFDRVDHCSPQNSAVNGYRSALCHRLTATRSDDSCELSPYFVAVNKHQSFQTCLSLCSGLPLIINIYHTSFKSAFTAFPRPLILKCVLFKMSNFSYFFLLCTLSIFSNVVIWLINSFFVHLFKKN